MLTLEFKQIKETCRRTWAGRDALRVTAALPQGQPSRKRGLCGGLLWFPGPETPTGQETPLTPKARVYVQHAATQSFERHLLSDNYGLGTTFHLWIPQP